MTLTQRITTVIQQRKIMQRHLEQERSTQPGETQSYRRPTRSNNRVIIYRDGKRV